MLDARSLDEAFLLDHHRSVDCISPREMTPAVVERRDSGDGRPERSTGFSLAELPPPVFVNTWSFRADVVDHRRATSFERQAPRASLLAEPARRRVEGPILEMEFLNALS